LRPQNSSGSANVHEARTALGKRLRDLRRQADLSGRQVAESLSWPPSKVSKLENGRQTPTDEDIRGWTRVTNSEGETEALLASLHTLEVQHAEWQRILRTGLKPVQQQLYEDSLKTRLFRVYEVTVIPALLQTPGYARARLIAAARRFVANDVDDAVQARMQRQEVLYRHDKQFHFVISEAALRLRLCSVEDMLGQLDRLVSLSALPNVRLGVIAFETAYRSSAKHGFWLYDNDRVKVETISAALDLRQPQEIELYSAAFEELASVASYGRAARAIINRVIEDLAAELPEDGE